MKNLINLYKYPSKMTLYYPIHGNLGPLDPSGGVRPVLTEFRIGQMAFGQPSLKAFHF